MGYYNVIRELMLKIIIIVVAPILYNNYVSSTLVIIIPRGTWVGAVQVI